jgi:lipopolysaccharide transport system ATP-binding protein
MSEAHGVEFNHVWKKFHRGEVHDSLRDLVPAAVRRLTGRRPAADALKSGDFWALRDVSFAVKPGETLGIIGHNGAGKSTVLKVLTKILRPTKGTYSVRGRIGALIEISAGFHPDLTGGENVYLQGAIMGMSGSEIRSRFDAIVEFSGIADFIDTPVKRYSSGMNARLGFSIAAHLDPDVLIIDEVLSVGDFSFQNRAFDRIRTLARSGLPVVLVSHQLDRVAELCTSAILLSHGQVVRAGTPPECIAAYLAGEGVNEGVVSEDVPVRLDAIRTEDGSVSPVVVSGQVLRVSITGVVDGRGVPDHLEPVGVSVRSASTGQIIFSTSNARCQVPLVAGEPFEMELALQMNVPAGIYSLETGVWDRARERRAAAGPAISVRVAEGPSFTGVVQLNPAMRLARAPALTR